MSINFKVDEKKCIHCGLCIKDCMSKVFNFDENNIPKVTSGKENSCIKCQHCLSVCPVGAISIFDKNSDDSSAFKHDYNSDELLDSTSLS